MIGATNRKTPMPALRLAAVSALIALALAGCGRKGALEPPGAVEEPAATPTVFGASPPAPPPPEPERRDEPFILDPLI